jgi:hypothetical protein
MFGKDCRPNDVFFCKIRLNLVHHMGYSSRDIGSRWHSLEGDTKRTVIGGEKRIRGVDSVRARVPDQHGKPQGVEGTYTVFGSVVPEDMAITEEMAMLPTSTDVWSNVTVRLLNDPVYFKVKRKSNGSTM